MPPSAITVCALPSSDFDNDGDLAAGGRCLDGSAQARAARSDDQNIVFMRDVLRH